MPNYLSPGVYVEELEAASRPLEGVGTAVAAFVGLTSDGPFNEPTLVTNWAQYTRTFGDPLPGSYLGHSVYGYFLNGGGQAYVVRVGGPASGNGQSRPQAALPAADGDKPGYVATALDEGTTGISIEVGPAEGENPPEDSFKVVIRAGERVEEFDQVTSKRGRTNVVTVVNAQSQIVRLEETRGVADRRPNIGVVQLTSPLPTSVVPAPNDYVGDPSDRTGFGGLEAIEGVTMVMVPDLMAAYQAGSVDMDGVKAVQTAMIAHCELMGDRMAVLDAPPEMNAQQINDWRRTDAGYDSKYAALYWPWIKVFDPVDGVPRLMPPSGHMAGIWARNDAERGVHKAPANEIVRGAIGLATSITRGEHDLLNPNGINCIRSFPGRGIRVWGARTLSSDPSWRYINVRRLYNYVESSVKNGTQWVVFEPNDKGLWERVVRTIRSFLFRVWADGGLFGDTVDQAFYVKCDDETNPSEVIEAGQLICEIGMAVVKPAEFVVFRLAQMPTGVSAISE